MSELNEVYKRLDAGDPPSPKDIDIIVAEMRRQLSVYINGGSKAKSSDDEAVEDIMKLMKSKAPAPVKTPIRRC